MRQAGNDVIRKDGKHFDTFKTRCARHTVKTGSFPIPFVHILLINVEWASSRTHVVLELSTVPAW